MSRPGVAAAGRRRAGRVAALAAVLMLLIAPWIARPAAAGAETCGMAAMASLPAGAPNGRHDAACSAACALCCQLAPVREFAASRRARVHAAVRYARLEVLASHVEPKRATPPPR